MSKYSKANPLDEMTNEEFEMKLDKIAAVFDLEWLEKKSDNLLQKIWKETDFLSSKELLILSYSLELLDREEYRDWFTKQIKKIKGKDINNQKGALFELIGISQLFNIGKVIPVDKPGIDCIVELDESNKINISMKNFGISTHEAKFYENCEKIIKILKEEGAKNKRNFNARMIFSEYIDILDSELVRRYVIELFEKFNELPLVCIIPEIGEIFIHPLISDEYSTNRISWTFNAISPLHKNEFKNLTDKIDKANSNLKKSRKVQTSSEVNGIWIHLHENADILECKKYVEEYFKMNQIDLISFVLLYQPSAIRNLDNSSIVEHTYLLVKTEKFDRFIEKNKVKLKIDPFIGQLSCLPSKRYLVADNVVIEIKENYLFQKGEIIKVMKQNEKGEGKENLHSPAPGVKEFLEISINGKSAIGKPKIYSEMEFLQII